MNNSFMNQKGKLPHEIHFTGTNIWPYYEYTNSIVIDLFDIFSSITYNDFYLSENTSGKNMNVDIPVSNYDVLIENTDLINEIVSYMTHEKWEVHMTPYITKKSLIFDPVLNVGQTFSSLMLFSGGIDSFCGGFEEQKKGESTLFLNIVNNLEESNIAKLTYNTFFDSNNNCLIQVKRERLKGRTNYTQRTRSLLFIFTALLLADINKINLIKLYENGIVSLNPNVTGSRIMTKTTHPRIIYLINKLLNNLMINIGIVNPYDVLTKGDLIKSLNQKALEYLEKTKTCSKSMSDRHFKGERNNINHCGICLSCINRQISFYEVKYDTKYFLPSQIWSKKSVAKYFFEYHNHNYNVTKSDIDYSYNHKKSLLAYYSSMEKKISNNSIISYLDIKRDWFKTDDFEIHILNMFKRFELEIHSYLSRLEK